MGDTHVGRTKPRVFASGVDADDDVTRPPTGLVEVVGRLDLRSCCVTGAGAASRADVLAACGDIIVIEDTLRVMGLRIRGRAPSDCVFRMLRLRGTMLAMVEETVAVGLLAVEREVASKAAEQRFCDLRR